MEMQVYHSNEKKLLVVNVECEKNQVNKQLQIELTQLTYDKFLKKILRNVHISFKNLQSSILQMEHMGLKIVVSNDEDLQFISRAQLLNNEPINVSIQVAQQTNHKQQIVFNEDGQKINEEFALNEPSDPRYIKKQKRTKPTGRDNAENQKKEKEDENDVICAFCKESINNLEYIKKLGWFYGPFKHKKNQYYVHLMCAIWTPAVFLHEETNKMMNIRKEIQRSNKIMCKSCGLLGGGLGCTVQNCKQSFHFKCALSENIDTRLDHQKYELYCPQHSHILDEKVEQEMDNVHCEKCKVDDNEDLILLCDNCDKALHTYCLDNKLDSIPDGDWFCPECQDKMPKPLVPSFNIPNFNSNKLQTKDSQKSKIQNNQNIQSQRSSSSQEIRNKQYIDINSQQNILVRENSKNSNFSQQDNIWNLKSLELINNERYSKKMEIEEQGQNSRKNLGLGEIFFS